MIASNATAARLEVGAADVVSGGSARNRGVVSCRSCCLRHQA